MWRLNFGLTTRNSVVFLTARLGKLLREGTRFFRSGEYWIPAVAADIDNPPVLVLHTFFAT